MKNKINHQNDVIYIRKICNKLSEHDRQKSNKKLLMMMMMMMDPL